ncbi:hypothetical protein S83_002017 [Arachis hypogaea]
MEVRLRSVVTYNNPESSMGAQNSSWSHHTSGALFFFLGGIIVLIILLILLFVYWMVIKRRSPQEAEEKMEKKPSIMSQHHDEVVKVTFSSKQQPGSMDFFSGSLGTISHFNLNTLRRATRNFHSKNLLGSGGFGPVYQGKLADGRLVAVKQLSAEKSQQGEKEFLAEVRLITSIQHKNLVRLLGCCTDGSQRILVYEYMKNKSLDRILYGT